jgi:phage tail-like protein
MTDPAVPAAETVPPARYALGPGLPGIFRPVLTREDAALLRELADTGRPAEGDERRRADGAHALLGLEGANRHHAAARASRDDFVWRLCDAFDEVLAPVVRTLDSLEAYVDPWTTPRDFLGWLGGWLALRDRTDWPEEGWRALIAESAWLYGRRGTPAALRRTLELYTAGAVTVDDSDSGGWVPPGEDAAQPSPPTVVIRIAGARRSGDDAAFRRGIDSLIDAIKPVHVVQRIEWTDA